jgi:glycosyltransferase involved in cell wall biosynthesis
MLKSVIIPTYKHLDLLKKCCESIIKYTDFSDEIEIIIVANGCGNDGTKEYVESLGKPFKLLWYDEGLGFTKATNRGVEFSKGEIIILMNNDCELLPQNKHDWIRYLCEPLKEKVGLTCNLKIWDGSVERMFGVFFLCAFPRFIWDRIGGLDESWTPGGGEDIEFNLKVENLGFKILQVPDEENVVMGGINVNRFPNYHVGEGTMLDEEHQEMWNKHILEVRAKLAYKYKLPPGWFYGGDIAEYRRLVEDVHEGGTIGELGCAYGRSICSVADIIKRKNLKVIVVDCFTGTKNEPGAWGDYNFRKEFEYNIMRFGIKDNVKIYEGLTTEIVSQISDKTFDLLFIDADHAYEAVKKDIEDWEPKIKNGGTISGHDYGNHPGVAKAVNEKYIGVRVNDIKFGIDSGVATGSVWSKRL